MVSSEGVQQGDTLGTLLFCLTIHKLCNKLKSEFSTFYLDDGKLGGNCDDVINDLMMIRGWYQGLVLSVFPGLPIVNMEDATLLGSLLGKSTCVDRCIIGEGGEIEVVGGENWSLAFS